MRLCVHFNRLSFVCIVVAALTASASASASHFYGTIKKTNVAGGAADRGDLVYVNTDILFTNTCNDFVNHELWYGVNGDGSLWVEVGHKDGLTFNSGCMGDVVFWADNRSGGGYHEHFPGYGFTYDAAYQMYIQRTSSTSCSWDVYDGGVLLGTSTSNCPGTQRYLEAGIESTTQSAAFAKGWLTNWYREDSSGTWNLGWQSPAIKQDSPPYIQFTGTQPQTEEVLNESF